MEVYYPTYGWGTVCDDDWSIEDGNVVCRQLGYDRAKQVYDRAHFGEGNGSILLDNLQCTGYEKHLWDCPHNGWTIENCQHSEDAGVHCKSGHYKQMAIMQKWVVHISKHI